MRRIQFNLKPFCYSTCERCFRRRTSFSGSFQILQRNTFLVFLITCFGYDGHSGLPSPKHFQELGQNSFRYWVILKLSNKVFENIRFYLVSILIKEDSFNYKNKKFIDDTALNLYLKVKLIENIIFSAATIAWTKPCIH